MSNPPGSANDPHAHRRAVAARRSWETVDRLDAGLRLLAEQGRAVTARTVHEVTGLDYKTIHRNPAALALFRAHSTALRSRAGAGGAGAGGAGAGAAARSAKDPLEDYSRQRLLDTIRKLRKRVAALERRLDEQPTREAQYDALVQEHATCALTIERLKARVQALEGMEAIVKTLRGHLTRQEFDVQ